jgi:hypothetical protein
MPRAQQKPARRAWNSSLPASTKPIARGGKPKARNPKRRASEFARTYHSRERVEFVKAQPCIVSGYSPCDNAHIEGDGAGRKAHYTKIVPLLRKYHRELHQSRAAFEKRYDVDLDALAAITELAWQAFLRGDQ